MTSPHPSTFAESFHLANQGSASTASRKPTVRASRSDRALTVSGICALAFSLAGCGLWLDIPDDPRWVPDAAAPTSEPALPSVSSVSVVDAPPMPAPDGVGTPAQPASASTPGSDSADRTPDADPIDAGSAPPDLAPLGPTPPADPASPADPAPEDLAPPADPAPEDLAPPADPAPEDPAPEDPAPEDPAAPSDGVQQPPRCRGVESTGPNDRCYLAVSASLSWSDARRNCRARGNGWDLATIRSNAINRFVGNMIADEAWIGASDAADEGQWAWVGDQTPFWRGTAANGNAVNRAFESWSANQPNGSANTNCARLATPNAAALLGNPTWADVECEDVRPSVCEGPQR
jgi:hypothetical protein